MGLNDTLVTRAAYRDALRQRLDDEFEGEYRNAIDLVDDIEPNGEPPAEGEPESLEGRGLSGLRVLTRADVGRVIETVFSERLGPASQHHAELSTPATVYLAAICPRCDIAGNVVVTLHPELLVTDEGAEIRVKAKTKPVPHVCGQMPLETAPEDAEADGQMSLDGYPPAHIVHGALSLVMDDAEIPPLEVIEGWDPDTRQDVATWASARHLVASDHDDVEIPPRPTVLGEEGEVWTATAEHDGIPAEHDGIPDAAPGSGLYDVPPPGGDMFPGVIDSGADESGNAPTDDALLPGGPTDDEDLRPTGEVNPDALRGEAERATLPEEIAKPRRRKR